MPFDIIKTEKISNVGVDMKRNNTVYLITLCGLILAIMLIFGFTPLGTIKMIGLSITLMGIPVAIIACAFGPWMGMVAGFIWGSIALIQAFTGMDTIGTLILTSDMPSGIKYGGIFSICYCRIFVGFLTGLIYDAIRVIDRKGFVAPFIASMMTAILNTLFFMSIFVLFFYKTSTIQELCSSYNLDPNNAFLFVCGFVGVNFFAEFITNMLIGGGASLGINKAIEKMGISSPLPHFFKKKENN